MTTLVGKGREPLLVMFATLALLLPVLYLAGASYTVGVLSGLVVTIACGDTGVHRIESAREQTNRRGSRAE